MRGLVLIAAMVFAGPVQAGYDSAYTDINLKKCKQLTPETSGEEGESSGTIECKGYKGLAVTFAEGDLRSFVAFGRDGASHCAFHQTFGGFNSVGNKVEWRLKDGKAIASILRWTVSYDPAYSEKTKDWLVVTKLEDGQSCQIGYVEGSYPKANEKARWLADTAAEVFSCPSGQTIFFANPGTAVDGIATAGGCED